MRVSLKQFTMESGSATSSKEVALLKLSPEPGAEPPVSADTPVQEILFKPPELPGITDKRAKKDSGVVLTFAMSDPHVAIRMQRAVRDVYALYGEAGWSPLMDAIAGDPMRLWKLKGEPSLMTGPYLTSEAPLRRKLRDHFFEEQGRLEEVLAQARSSVEKVAVRVARERLTESQKQVLREAKRYLSLRDKDDRTAAAALESSATWPLSGSDIVPLATAVLRIDEARKPLRQAKETYEKNARPVREKRVAYFVDQHANLYPEDITAQDIVDLLEEAERAFPDTQEMLQAQQDIAEREAELAAFVAAEAVAFPILYRMWDIPLAGAIRQALAEHRPTNDVQARRALDSSPDFRKAVLTSLRRTWEAATECLRRLEEQELVVWRYSPLIVEAAQRLAVPRERSNDGRSTNGCANSRER